MKNENYINIQGWMINELKLKGNKLSLYALIYGFSQDGENEYRASFKYIGKALGIKRRQAIYIINWLVENNYIVKTIGSNEGTNSYKYNADLVQRLHHPSAVNCTTPSAKIAPLYNNIYIHKDIHRSTSGENEKSFSSLEGNLTKITPPSSARPPSDAQKYASEVEKVFQGYESHFKTKLRVRSDSRKSKVKKILKHFSIEEVLKSIEYYSKDSWYTGQNDRNWKVDIDYIIRKPEHIEKGLALKPKQSNPYW
jgi:hypothetical protein